MLRQLIISTLLTVTANCILFSQAPAIVWQKSFGGTGVDIIRSFISTTDGGFIFCGESNSHISGDKTEEPVGGVNNDLWIVKTNSAGDIIWENTIGGTNQEIAGHIIETSDGGYLICGESISPISGDKTAFRIGGFDYWVIKINSTGIIEWNKTYGGSSFDHLTAAVETPDGYLLAGYSSSGIGGYKSEINFGLYDYWIVKINTAGDFIWDKTYGGSDDEGLAIDNCLKITPDGGFIIAGYSSSGISGNKTEPALVPGSYDCWILKLDAVGNIIWQNTISGNLWDRPRTVDLTIDGGYIIGATSESGISGDKTENSHGLGDYWIIKLNASGNIVWQNTIGGNQDEQMACIITDPEGNFIVAGNSTTGISGDKTTPAYGNPDYWILKLNNLGSIIWQTSLGGSGFETMSDMVLQSDGSIVAAGWSNSGISGNKTVNTHGDLDYFVVKYEGDCDLMPETCNSLDDNCNGIIDEGVVETINISAGGATTFCQGNSVLLSAIYSGTSVQWKKNGTNIAGATSSTYSVNKSGNYTAVTTSPCNTATSSSISVTVNKNPNASISAAGATTFCAGGSVTLTEVPLAGCSYQWYRGASLLAGATSTNYIATTSGNYKCRVTKTATGCFKNSNTITVTVPCKEGLNHDSPGLKDSPDFVIYPNPNNGTFTITFALWPLCEINIYNPLGQLIYSKQIESSGLEMNETINLENMASGIYIIRMNDGVISTEQKLIIE